MRYVYDINNFIWQICFNYQYFKILFNFILHRKILLSAYHFSKDTKYEIIFHETWKIRADTRHHRKYLCFKWITEWMNEYKGDIETTLFWHPAPGKHNLSLKRNEMPETGWFECKSNELDSKVLN